MSKLTDEQRQVRDNYRRLKQLQADSQAVMQWTRHEGETMTDYLNRTTFAATCGNEDAKACLVGVMNTYGYRWWSESQLQAGATVH